MMNMVWRSEVDPSEDLTKLSQFTGAYTAVTMDKTIEVSHPMREKDQRITQLQVQPAEQQQKINQLEQQLIEQRKLNEQLKEQLKLEKQRIKEQTLHKQKELFQELSMLEILREQEKKAKEEQIAQMKEWIEKYKGYPQVSEFRT